MAGAGRHAMALWAWGPTGSITSNQCDFPATITAVQVTYPADLAGPTG